MANIRQRVHYIYIRNRTLIIGRRAGAGGQQNGEGVASEVSIRPKQKGGGGVLAMLKGGHNKFLGSFNTGA